MFLMVIIMDNMENSKENYITDEQKLNEISENCDEIIKKLVKEQEEHVCLQISIKYNKKACVTGCSGRADREIIRFGMIIDDICFSAFLDTEDNGVSDDFIDVCMSDKIGNELNEMTDKNDIRGISRSVFIGSSRNEENNPDISFKEFSILYGIREIFIRIVLENKYRDYDVRGIYQKAFERIYEKYGAAITAVIYIMDKEYDESTAGVFLKTRLNESYLFDLGFCDRICLSYGNI